MGECTRAGTVLEYSEGVLHRGYCTGGTSHKDCTGVQELHRGYKLALVRAGVVGGRAPCSVGRVGSPIG